MLPRVTDRHVPIVPCYLGWSLILLDEWQHYDWRAPLESLALAPVQLGAALVSAYPGHHWYEMIYKKNHLTFTGFQCSKTLKHKLQTSKNLVLETTRGNPLIVYFTFVTHFCSGTKQEQLLLMDPHSMGRLHKRWLEEPDGSLASLCHAGELSEQLPTVTML